MMFSLKIQVKSLTISARSYGKGPQSPRPCPPSSPCCDLPTRRPNGQCSSCPITSYYFHFFLSIFPSYTSNDLDLKGSSMKVTLVINSLERQRGFPDNTWTVYPESSKHRCPDFLLRSLSDSLGPLA